MSLRQSYLKNSSQRGFSIVELMIAMVLGLVLMGGVIQAFISTKQTYNLNEEMAWIQENARFSVGFMAEDLRMAGYYGCASRASSIANVLKDPDTSWVTDFGKGIHGYDGDSTSFPNTVFPRPVTASLPNSLPKTDVFTIHKADLDNAFQVVSHNANSSVIGLQSPHNFPDGTILIVSDCHHSAVFQSTAPQQNKVNHNPGNSVSPGNCTKGLGLPVVCSANGTGYTYKEDAFVMRAIGHAYYIDTASNGVPSLFRESLDTGGSTTTAEEMVQGVENMQIQYGLDKDGDSIPDRYVDASDVGDDDWETNVVSARITLLLRSLTELASTPQAFSYLGTSYTPTDNYVRRVYSTTVKLRNRGV
ncbi:MAG: pilus assembly protein PilW [Pseudomonadales bacterium]|nr:pilus assembly protein PilW [Pseudomonadales bacterium]